MQAGKLNQIIEIHAPEFKKNEFGELVQQYVKRCSTRAEVVYNNGNAATENNEKLHNDQKTFKVRFYISIDETCQIKFQDKMYRILSIDSINKWNEKIIITEKVND